MGPNSDLTHLLKQHNYYLIHAIFLTVKSLPPSGHCVRVTTSDSVYYSLLTFFLFKQGIFFFLFKKSPSSVTVSCFTILHNCLCKEQSIKTTLLQIFLPILHSSSVPKDFLTPTSWLVLSANHSSLLYSFLLILSLCSISEMILHNLPNGRISNWLTGKKQICLKEKPKNAWHRSKDLY